VRTAQVVRINPDALERKLLLRGQSWEALRASHVASYSTLAKIRRGESVKPRVLQNILVQLIAWPELEGAADLIDGGRASE
jgi:hypothetical protein